MCGRASHSARSVTFAAQSLAATSSTNNSQPSNTIDTDTTRQQDDGSHDKSSRPKISLPINLQTNHNTSPGMTTHAFRRKQTKLECIPMTWGLSGQRNKRLFNARHETIYEKPTFRPLISGGETCLWAVDGYYEWREKQPYFVGRVDGLPLLLAGLCREERVNGIVEDVTFTILTMDAYSKMAWLHPRQPVILWENDVALQWLCHPDPALLKRLVTACESEEERLRFYPVTKRMSDGKYRGEDCTKEIRLSSVKSFFGAASAATETVGEPIKKRQDQPESTDDMGQTKKHALNESSWDQKMKSSNNEIWVCQVCTFEHTGESINFLSCEMCGAKRDMNMSTSQSLKSSENDAPSKQGGEDTNSRAWGSLCSPNKSLKKRKL
jgi:putative SOS response-associated peptidase YedK